MQDVDVGSLLWAIGILALPLFMAIPARFVWHRWVAHTLGQQEYRAKVKSVLDGGNSLIQHREELDNHARKRNLDYKQVERIETDVLFPLGLHHFILFPALVIILAVIIPALPLFLLAIPMMYLVEWILIERKVLVYALKFLQDWTKWGIIHIPQAHSNHDKLHQGLVSFHRMPRSVFLGLFAWLIVHWTLRADTLWIELLISGVIYLVMLSVLEVISNAIAAELVFADASRSSLIQVEAWAESYINPLVGVGLLFLLGRDLMAEARDGNPILFALTVLLVLYSVTFVGAGAQLVYSKSRGTGARNAFTKQVVEVLDPNSYSFTRKNDILKLQKNGKMSEHLDGAAMITERDRVSFEMIDSLPSRLDSEEALPPERPNKSANSDSTK